MNYKSPELLYKHWLKQSEEDIKSVEILLQGGRYTWSAFICQQAIEKCLKSVYVKSKRQVPP